MESMRRILFPVDLSENPDKLVPNVITMVNKFNTDLHLLFVVRIFQYFTNIYVPHPSISVFENELVEGATKKMEEFKQAHFSTLKEVRNAVVLGDPAETILRYVDENEIDMVIMGTHGRKGLDRVFFGSVAVRVIKGSPVPVLVINPIKAAQHSEL
jgi:nucleotide-binding universal stress UspA family protein